VQIEDRILTPSLYHFHVINVIYYLSVPSNLFFFYFKLGTLICRVRDDTVIWGLN